MIFKGTGILSHLADFCLHNVKMYPSPLLYISHCEIMLYSVIMSAGGIKK